MAMKFVSKVKLKEYVSRAEKNANTGLQDCVDDLVRTSSQSAPHDEGILEKSWSKEVRNGVGTVSYSAKKRGGKGNYNYALKMHEENYKLGDGSRAKSGGTGMSGKKYPVGKGFLANVLKGEEEAYNQHIEKMVKKI